MSDIDSELEIGYSKGLKDGFLNHLKSYRLSKKNSIFKLLFSRVSPEKEYIYGYEEGFKHGEVARNAYITETGKPPKSMSDFEWFDNIRPRKYIDYRDNKSIKFFHEWLRDEWTQHQNYTDEFAENNSEKYEKENFPSNLVYEKYTYFKSLISKNQIYRSIKETMYFFFVIKNYNGYISSGKLLDRLIKSREATKNNEITQEMSRAELAEISFSLNKLIDEEIKPIIDSNNKNDHIKTNNEISSESLHPTINNASEFVLAYNKLIQHIIIDNWKIPQTQTPGLYAETYNRIILWFDNFKKSEYDLALLILQNIKYISSSEIDSLLNKMCGELKNLFLDDFSTVGFLGLGNYSSDSGNQFLYSLKQKLKLLNGNFPTHLDNIPRHIESLVFVDDIIGTGKQAKDFYKNYLLNLKVEKYYYSLMAFEGGIKNLKANSGFNNVFTTKILTESEKAFSDTSEVFRNEETRKRIKEVANFYGEMLYPRGALGYDDSQALIVFQHNTPNNTLPIIWASENNEKALGIPWNPIWERKKVIELKTNKEK